MSLRPQQRSERSPIVRSFGAPVKLNNSFTPQKTFLIEISFDNAIVYRSIESNSFNRYFHVEYKESHQSSGGEVITSTRALFKKLIQEAADSHEEGDYKVYSEPFTASVDLSTCPPMEVMFGYDMPWKAANFQNALIEALTSYSQYKVFRDFGCGSAFPEESDVVNYDLL